MPKLKERKNHMSRPRILDVNLLRKVASKLKKNDLKKVNVVISQKADKLGISPEAALVLISKELGIGSATYQRSLDPNKQAEIRDLLPSIFAKIDRKSYITKKSSGFKDVTEPNQRARLKAAIEYLIQDQELKNRCQDLLLAPSSFDRPINQATLVLEDRIRKKAQPSRQLVGVDLVNYAFKGDLSITVLKVSDNPGEQDGFANILRGMALSFRNLTHHHITSTFTREEALRVCGFIDVLLKIIDNSIKIS